jgi:hypothetical protein
MFASDVGAYTSRAPFMGFIIVYAPGITLKYQAKLERPANDKQNTLAYHKQFSITDVKRLTRLGPGIVILNLLDY